MGETGEPIFCTYKINVFRQDFSTFSNAYTTLYLLCLIPRLVDGKIASVRLEILSESSTLQAVAGRLE